MRWGPLIRASISKGVGCAPKYHCQGETAAEATSACSLRRARERRRQWRDMEDLGDLMEYLVFFSPPVKLFIF
ncbi:hypothetical protein Y032_0025g1195 [Ancylostoma ceylanicum]|uniref:Uncharacterized protein n=1 Tax=Ancylostoma ceylanicum TaxID=53326 RepID=A0A016UXE8_9BILA|nr:hypothetical protein Y032_0025g1195 [Ancylostoma ceylanicum]